MCARAAAWAGLHKGEDVAVEMARHQEIVDSLQSFSEADDLKKLALEVMTISTPPHPQACPTTHPPIRHSPTQPRLRQVIAFSTPPAKLEELRNMFVKMDKDDSGTICRVAATKLTPRAARCQ